MTNYLPYVPYIASPLIVVRKMLEIARAGQEDVVYDLGCGDGRILITAVKEFNVRKAVGIEINEEKVKKAIENIKKSGVEGRATVIRGDFFEVDISEATVVTLFLLTIVNDMLKPKLERELKPGTRIVSHEFEIKGWTPEKVYIVEDESGMVRHKIYLYNRKPRP